MVTESPFRLYLVTCIPTGKIYVGITSNGIRQRWNSHKAQARAGNPTKLSRCIRKYGEDAFVIEHIASCRSFSDLLRSEQAVIAQFDSKRHGLNSTIGGDGVRGHQHSDEARSKFSVKRRLLWQDQTYRDLTSRRIKEGWHSRSDEEIKRHQERARKTLSQHRRPRPKKAKPVRWKGKGWNMSSRTHCAQGHEFSPENTRFYKPGIRTCLACKRAGRNVARDRRRAQERATA